MPPSKNRNRNRGNKPQVGGSTQPTHSGTATKPGIVSPSTHEPPTEEDNHGSVHELKSAMSSLSVSKRVPVPTDSRQRKTSSGDGGERDDEKSQSVAEGKRPVARDATPDPPQDLHLGPATDSGTAADSSKDNHSTGEERSDQKSHGSQDLTPQLPAEYDSKTLLDASGNEDGIEVERQPVNPGQSGVRGVLSTNYFRFVVANWVLYRYSVKIQPRKERERELVKEKKNKNESLKPTSDRPGDIKRSVRRRILHLALSKPPLNKKPIATDYSGIVIALQDLGPMVRTKITEKDWAGNQDDDQTRYNVTLEFNKEIKVHDYMEKINSGEVQACFSDPEGILQAVNIVAVHQIMKAQLGGEGPRIACLRNFKYFPITETPGEKLAWYLGAFEGFVLSTKFSTDCLLLNLKKTAGHFYLQMNLLDYIEAANKDANLNRVTLLNLCHGIRVRTQHRDAVKTLSGDYCLPMQANTWYKAGTQRFERTTEEGRKGRVTVKAYFDEMYPDIPVARDDLLVNVRSNEKGQDEYIPAKLCRIVHDQEFPKRFLTTKHEDKFIKFAKTTPPEYRDFLLRIAVPSLAISDTSDDPTSFGRLIRPELVKVDCRILKAPTLTYGAKTLAPNASKGSWVIGEHKFSKAMELPKWGYLRLGTDFLDSESITNYQEALRSEMQKHGINVRTEAAHVHDGSEYNQMESAFHDIVKERLKFVFVFLPEKNDRNKYWILKRWADFRGIQTAAVAPMKKGSELPMLSTSPDVLANVILKINLKLGGINHTVGNQDLGLGTRTTNKTMIIGIDVTHLGVDSDAPSIAAVVANYNANCVQWPASIWAQDAGEEIVINLKFMMVQRLEKWKKENEARPHSIVVYRDGVSEGEYRKVVETELAAIHRAVKDVFPTPSNAPSPKITFIIVTKRHATRFFPTGNSGDKSPLPGTVVDTGITMKGIWDFYLQSHHSPAGTAKCTRYVVIKNENDQLDAEGVQKMTHGLCYMYSKAPRVPSVCPPAHFAHLACERGRRYVWDDLNQVEYSPKWLAKWDHEEDLEAPVHKNLKETMFYV